MRADDDPDTAWEEIESEATARNRGRIEQLAPHQGGRGFETIARNITATLDRFAQAGTRLWTLGALHEEAGRYDGVIKNPPSFCEMRISDAERSSYRVVEVVFRTRGSIFPRGVIRVPSLHVALQRVPGDLAHCATLCFRLLLRS